MKILFIGDVVGEPGRKAVESILPRLRDEHALDFVIANGENSAGGNGITPQIAGELFSAGVDVITSGDHLWDQKTVSELLYGEPRFLRPLNYPAGVPGRGANVFQVRHLPPVGVMNVQGRVFMPPMENPSPSPPNRKTWASGLARLTPEAKGTPLPWMKCAPWVFTKYGNRDEQPIPASVTMFSCGSWRFSRIL